MTERSDEFPIIQPTLEDIVMARSLPISRLAAIVASERHFRVKFQQSLVDRRSGVLVNDAFEDVAREELTQIIGFDEKRRDVPNQAIAIQGDIILFGKYNRDHGHNAGHAVIGNVGNILNSFKRPNSKDLAGRLGEGDEFGMLIFFRGDSTEEIEEVHRTINERFYELIYDAVETGLIPGFKWRSGVYTMGETYEDLMDKADPKKANSQSPVYEYPIVRVNTV
jgi:diguanylate cyclase (GGDEF)-like protein